MFVFFMLFFGIALILAAKKNGGYGEKGIRNRMPGKGKWQSSKFELAAQVYVYGIFPSKTAE